MARKETANQAPARQMSQRPSQADYEALSEFRYLIRCFLQFSQNAARAVGLTPRPSIRRCWRSRAFRSGHAVRVGDLAERLRIRHHSAVELVDRLSEAGLVRRIPDANDQRRVLLSLTDCRIIGRSSG
jgi:hypothetical protein